MAAPWTQRQMGSLSGRQHRLCIGYSSNKNTPNFRSPIFCQEDSPGFRITSALSPQRKVQQANEVFLSENTRSSASAPTQTVQLYLCQWLCFRAIPAAEIRPRVQHSPTAAPHVKRWMVSTAVTCNSHCNFKRRQTSRRRLLTGVGAQPHKITDALRFSSLSLIFTLPMSQLVSDPCCKLNTQVSN